MNLTFSMGGSGLGQVLAVVSGKGGTGKTSLCAAIACALAQEGQSVLLLDLDLGLRNLDLSLGLGEEPAIPFTAVMRGEYPLSRATAHPRFPGLSFLTAPVTEAPESVDTAQFAAFLQEARAAFDFVLLDAPAGVGAGFRLAVQCADQALVVTGSDPASLRDGARTAELLERLSQAAPRLVVNRIRRRFFRRTHATVDDIMDAVGLPLLGLVPEDEAVPLAAAAGEPLLSYASRGAALACRHIARRLLGIRQPFVRI